MATEGTVNREDRARLARALRAFVTGKITNFQFEEAVAFASDDPVVHAVSDQAWHWYDDLSEHRLHPLPAGRRYVARCLLFLRTEQPFQWPEQSHPLGCILGGIAVLTALAGCLLASSGHLALGLGLVVIPATLATLVITVEVALHDRRLERFGGDAAVWPFVHRSDLSEAMETWPQWAARSRPAHDGRDAWQRM